MGVHVVDEGLSFQSVEPVHEVLERRMIARRLVGLQSVLGAIVRVGIFDADVAALE